MYHHLTKRKRERETSSLVSFYSAESTLLVKVIFPNSAHNYSVVLPLVQIAHLHSLCE